MSTWGRVLGTASITAGVLGAAALGGITAQRRAVRRLHGSAAGDADPQQAYGALVADRTYSVVAEDGVALHVEEAGPADAPITMVFAHGWTLRSGAWHYQRLGLAGPGFGTGDGPTPRMVFYDQRSHGRSSRAAPGRSTLDALAGDLAAVIATAAPEGPLVLVGHSMGGMALIALAGRQPELFADRVVGVGLVSTAAQRFGIPGLGNTLLAGTTSPLLRLLSLTAGRYTSLIERGRAGTHDAVWLLTRTLGFARTDVPAAVVDYLDEMISGTPVDVIADFAPALVMMDEADSLPALAGIPTVIVCGDSDRMTPAVRSEFLAHALPDAELVIIAKAGHMATLEAPEEVNAALRRMCVRAVTYAERTHRPVSA
ncbi:alpha/beta fold hydrolase [Nakamurella endophytica]|uniref:Alpha/beta hydrolase n=1 Tax=Nakamurella endophytica TaxID=1748367 RepID=A0A917SYT7_9ACTN|nr:alpha/beta hydrolase [Nakamurella endophytica]GGM03046.1 alpha/beta hydrolase [Nakamurella endophytica]